jgi:membrane protein
MAAKGAWDMVKTAFKDFFDDRGITFAASLAYYTLLSLAPLVVLMLSVTSWLGVERREALIERVQEAAGPQVGQTLTTIIENASARPMEASVSAILGIGLVVLAATAVFGQLQKALNAVWDVRPKTGNAVWGWIRKRLAGLGVVVLIGLVLLAAVIASAVLQAVLPSGAVLWSILDIVLSLAVFTALLGFIFKYLPDADLAWKDVWVGAAMTGVLVVAGKFAVGLYLGRSTVASSYGAAGSLVVMLIAVFYGWIVVMLGAELTQAWARQFGQGIHPQKHAVLIEGGKRSKHERASQEKTSPGQAKAA